jgi:exosortase F-associated protein
MNKLTRLLIIVILFVLLIVIRGYVAPYFYDPLNDYFKNDYLNAPLPEIEFSTYFIHLFLRFVLNTIVSLALIYLFFMNKKLLVFAVKFYGFSFLLLVLTLYLLLKFNIKDLNMFIFYVRRFLIQPLFVLILLPAFYYQILKGNN